MLAIQEGGSHSMHGIASFGSGRFRVVGVLAVLGALALSAGAASSGAATLGQDARPGAALTPQVTWAAAHDVSPPLRDLAQGRVAPDADDPADEPDLGPISGADSGYSSDGALQSALLPAAIPSTQQNFEGLSNQDNFDTVGLT